MGLSEQNARFLESMCAVDKAGTVSEWRFPADMMNEVLNACRSEATEAQARRIGELEAMLEKAVGDRDTLRQALNFIPGPLDEDRDNDIVIRDAKALRPAMVAARREVRRLQSIEIAPLLRTWAKARFGKWITWKTAWAFEHEVFALLPADTKEGEG